MAKKSIIISEEVAELIKERRQEFTAHNFPSYFYCSHNVGELDFVIEHDQSVLPIEVKSGKDYYVHSAIKNVADNVEYGVREAYVLANCNIEKDGKIDSHYLHGRRVYSSLRKINKEPYRPSIHAR